MSLVDDEQIVLGQHLPPLEGVHGHEGVVGHHDVHLVGPGTFDKLSLKRGYLVANTQFYQWMKDLHDPAKGKGSGQRHNFDLVVMDDAGAESGRYSFFNAFISNYSVDAFNAKTGEIIVE